MQVRTQRGEGKLGAIVGLLVLGAVVMAAFNVVPVYYANYSFQDKVVELARAPRYSHNDDRILELLHKAAEEYRIEEFINRQTCKVTTLETRRTIVCEYDQPVRVIPGYVHTFHFRNEADQPLI